MEVPKLKSDLIVGGNSLTISGGRAVLETICLEEAEQYHRPAGRTRSFGKLNR